MDFLRCMSRRIGATARSVSRVAWRSGGVGSLAHAVLPLYYYTSKHLVRPEVNGFQANPLDRHPSRFLSLEPSP